MDKLRFLDLQYNSYINDLKKIYAVFLFVTLCCRDMKQNRLQNMALPMNGAVFAGFALINKNQ